MIKELAAVFRTPFLRNILIVALVTAAVFPVYLQHYGYPRLTALLLRFTEDDSERVARYLGAILSPSGTALSRASLTPAFQENARLLQTGFRLERLKVFAPDGEVIHSSAPADIGQRNQHDYFHQQVARGQVYSKVVRKESLTAEGRFVKVDVVETYVPLMHEGRFLGAFEVYFDITTRRDSLDALLEDSTAITYGMAAVLLLAVLVALVVAGRSERTREVAREALRRSEARLHNMAASAQDAIVEMDAQGHVSFWNRAAERLFGFSEGEVLGQDLHRLVAPPRFHAAFAAGFQGFLASGQGRLLGKTTELVGLRKDGSEFPIEISIAATHDARDRRVIGIIRDIRERKEAEQRLKLGASVISHAAQGITVTDAEANIQLVNPAFTRLTGYTLEEVIGGKPSRLKSGRHGPEFYDRMWRELLETGSWQGEIWNRRKNGEVYPEWLSLSAIYDDHGKITNFIGMFSDISQLKAAEQDLERLAFYDPLTAVPNRLLFRERLQQAMRMTDRMDKAYQTALLYIDLDYFKQVNDIHGHEVGDLLLQEVAARIGALVRDVDTVARLGGDEFAVVLVHLPDPATVTRVADEIIVALTAPFHLGDAREEIRIGASIGIALYPEHAGDIDTLVKLADAAMYEAKAEGRNRHRFSMPRQTT